MTDKQLIKRIERAWRERHVRLRHREVLKVASRWWVIGWLDREDREPVIYEAKVEPWGQTRLHISFALAQDNDQLTLEGLA